MVVWWCDGVVFSALLIVDFGLEEEADIWWWTILTVLLCECVLCCVTLREREDVDTAQHRPLSCQSSKSFTLWAGKWVEEWREKTVKITNNILTLCLTAVFMSWLEIKEVFTELCFHMSASQPGWWWLAGLPSRISEDQLQSGQAPLSAATAELLILSMIEEEGRRWRLYCW